MTSKVTGRLTCSDSQSAFLYDNLRFRCEKRIDLFAFQRFGWNRIVTIISTGHSSPPDFWYDQPKTEWVILLRGTATLEFQDAQLVRMKPGDYVLIPAHKKHRIFSTSASNTTVWLAVFIHNDGPVDKEE